MHTYIEYMHSIYIKSNIWDFHLEFDKQTPRIVFDLGVGQL